MEDPDSFLITARLQSEFVLIIKEFHGTDSVVQRWTNTLITRYTEPQRHYHTITHIYSMLQLLEDTKQAVHNRTAVKLAIFFHDIIYDPTVHDNELQSISTFANFAHDLQLLDSLQTRVTHYIHATISHSLSGADDEGDTDLHLFLDFDLEILSRAWPDYTRYAAQIRCEYEHFGEREYLKGRIGVLKKFLLRDRLYFSSMFRETCEERARDNLRREIEELNRRLALLESAEPSVSE